MGSCNIPDRTLQVVETVDLNRYTGTWYEIARFTHSFEKDLKCVTATYSLRSDGKIDVLNQGHKINESIVKKAKGVARIPDKAVPGKLKVTFFWPFSGDYWILVLGENYEYVLIGAPSRKYLWILSRSKILDENVFNRLVEKAKAQGFDIGRLERTGQDCDN
jgi:apolipoprotein D and lipocalin family protein